MTDPRELAYRLRVDDDFVPLRMSVTIGRHLDNDLVVAGEDVLDFHLRIDLSLRGPVAVPLREAVLGLNGSLLELPTGLMPGDRLEVGQSVIELVCDALDPAEAESWRLCAGSDPEGLPVRELLRVGREPGSHLHLIDLHASRRHARLYNIQGSIWVKDLDSANGTFINGERIRGARRLFHGDEVRFDHFSCQLLGRGADLTPARAASPRDRQLFVQKTIIDARLEGSDTLEFAVVVRPVPDWCRCPAGTGAGAYLVRANGTPGAAWHRLPMGRTLVGRQADCDVQLRDRTVSGHHAELILRPEGATLTDLMSTNGTLCNDRQAQNVRLEDGDRLQLGRVDLLYREIRPAEARSYPGLWILAAAATAIGLTVLLFWLL